jgi:hypothetical protein
MRTLHSQLERIDADVVIGADVVSETRQYPFG